LKLFFILIGDNYGLITVKRITDGKTVRHLNKIQKSRNDLDYKAERSINLDLSQRVCCLNRCGRLVFAGNANCSISVFDFQSSNSNPVAEYNTSLFMPKSISIKQGSVMYKVTKVKKNKKFKNEENENPNKPNISILSWFPHIS